MVFWGWVLAEDKIEKQGPDKKNKWMYSFTASLGGQHRAICLHELSPLRTDITVVLVRGQPEHTLQAKTKEHSFSLKQGKIFPPEVISSAQVVWVLYLLIRKCCKHKARSSVAHWGPKDYMHKETAFTKR